MRVEDAREPNTTCLACGSRYYHCKTCEQYKNINFWRSNACCPEHFKAYMLAHEYAYGEVSIADAKRQLKNIDCSGVLDSGTDVAQIIKEILATETKKKHTESEPQADSEVIE